MGHKGCGSGAARQRGPPTVQTGSSQLNVRLLLVSDLHGGITEDLTRQEGKVCSPSSATLRPRSLWADGWGFYSMGLASHLPSPTPAAGYVGRSWDGYAEPA